MNIVCISGTLNLPPEHGDVAVLAPGSSSQNTFGKLSVRMKLRGTGELQSIDALHPAYDPLSYVLLFPEGSQGYCEKLNVTPVEFYKYHLQVRDKESHYNILMRGGRLSQQYACDMFAKIESYRLQWVKINQKQIKAEKYTAVVDALNSDDETLPGRLTILPPSVYGSPRWYAKQFQDAMAIVRVKGPPDYFITFTCNPKWPEITQSIFEGQKVQDRQDIVQRVFHMKVEAFLKDLIKCDCLGHVDAYVMVKEVQKRTLPHVHLLLTMVARDKPRTAIDINKVISAEIPDKSTNPLLHNAVMSHMIHTPCEYRQECLKDGKCTRGFPKKIQDETIYNDDSFAMYRRRGGTVVQKAVTVQGEAMTISINNSWVVAYNPYLIQRYDAHINVENVGSTETTKYIYKYVEKGPDQCMAKLELPPEKKAQLKHDEIEIYELSRYISASEAFWRIYGFEIQWRSPAVQLLPLHLEDEQVVLFEDGGHAQDIINQGPPKTQLLAFFEAMAKNPEKRHIVYPDVLQHFTYASRTKEFKLRQRRKSGCQDSMSDTIGRLPIIKFNPHSSELYYLRMLLYKVPGPTCFEDLKKIDGHQHNSYVEACVSLGIVEDDEEMDKVLEEATNVLISGSAIREVFANLLIFVLKCRYKEFFERHRRLLCQDLMSQHNVNEPNEEMLNIVLLDIQKHIVHHGYTMITFGLPEPEASTPRRTIIEEESSYDTSALDIEANRSEALLTNEQQHIIDAIFNSVLNSKGKLIALDAPGGTGKTFLITYVLNKLRSQGKIVLATASSGIAATLLPNATTFHSRTKCPIVLHEDSTLNISEKSATADLIRAAHLMVIDEVTMMDRYALEAADRSFRSLRNSTMPFGGITIVFSGDWRQILTVVPHGSRSQIISRTLKSSYIWQDVEKFSLTVNMRVRQSDCTDATEQEIFSKYLLDLGDGNLPISEEHGEFAIPIDCRLALKEKKLSDLVEWVFPNINEHFEDPVWLSERAILSPTNKEVDEVNEIMTEAFPGEPHVFFSVDSTPDDGSEYMYGTEFLNTLCPSGLPPHKMTLKVGMVVMLLRNFNQKLGQCNGSRFVLENICSRVLFARSITGTHAGRILLIPRIPLSPSENVFPFTLVRRQFPIRPCFSMTVNKSQGQSLKKVGLYCAKDIFSHGQLYVAMSRVGRFSNIKVLALNKETKQKNLHINNVVYKEIL